ncbi:glucosyltransferase domain-containing protein [Clostridium sp. NSJ-6]|uniref:Glucosyltransferase domain-containing protein n=1 Tax=Clostridium hominis TaxID=2763036 RepID=A0ABR7D9J6_9CLOT|nr:glucosyltransferase domain-containing protein [Clostridium hominis]MBC5628056.1 glucosyltransferase domain-containing protein [Clostridium hominis]MDU2673181.1 glucosyltransferase domain-containing protein [Clostridium sp.]
MINKLELKIKSFSCELNSFVRNKNTVACFLSSIFWGILSYIYLFTNNLNIFDNIAMTPWGYGTGTSSGRWFLQEFGNFVGEIWGNYNVPIFIGLFSVLTLAVTSCIIIKIFDIKNKWNCILIGGITVVFPAIASTMLFTFTVGYYSLAIFFAILGIYLIYKYKIIGYFLGTLLFSFSLGIYQGYYPLTASIFVIILIQMCINQKFTFKEVILKGIKFFSALLVGYILYRLFLEYFLFTNNISLSSYEGIDEMGKIDLTLLPEQIKNIYKTLIKMPFSNYNEINGTRIIRYSFLGMYIITFINFLFITKKNFKKKNLSLIGLLLVLLIILPISIDSIVILVPNGRIYTLMQMAFVCIFYLAIITSDYNLEINASSYINKLLNFSGITIILIAILNYSWQSNVNYRAVYYENRILENYYETMYTRIKSIDNYNQDMDVYFVGRVISDKTFKSRWSDLAFRYGGNGSHLNTYSYSRAQTISNYLGYSYEEIDTNSEIYIENKEFIEEMDKYPNDNSIKIINDKIFVRLE